MRQFFISVVLILCVIGTADALDISAQSAILVEATTGKVLYSKNSDEERGMASTTKIMTAIIVLESADSDEIVTVKESCTGIEGSSMYLQPGEKLSVSDLLFGLMLKSGNDCAAALAEHIAGSEQEFVSLMNEKAKTLGLHHTRFINPSGLPDDEHFSTAHDMARLAAYAMQNEQFRRIVSTKSCKIGTRYLTNHNRLLSQAEGCDGIKTGFTKSSGRCLVTSAVRDGIRLIAVTLNAPNDWNDHQALYEFGFSTVKQTLLHKAGDLAVSLPIYGGTASELSVVFQADLTAITAAEETVTVSFHFPRFLYAPITKGDQIGTALIQDSDGVLSVVPLVANETVAMVRPKGLMYYIRKRFLG